MHRGSAASSDTVYAREVVFGVSAGLVFPDGESGRTLGAVGPRTTEGARERIAWLASQGLDVATFFHEAQQSVVAVVPSSMPPCWSTLDPASLLITSSQDDEGAEIPQDALAWEYLDGDAMTTVGVARSAAGIQTLLGATAGDPSRSRLYRDYLKPMGIEQALEVALRTRTGETWGSLGLVREAGEAEFSPDELVFLRAVAPHLGEGTRRGLLVAAAADATVPDDPGLVILGNDWRVDSLTPGVERLLAELPGGRDDKGMLPPAVVAVAARALRATEHERAPSEVAVARVLSRAGRWFVLHGAALVAGGARRAAVIIEPAHPARIIPLLMAAYGLSEREQDVTLLVLQGDSTAEIAEALFVSPHTVQQHLKAIFEKTGVRSRRALVGKVFFTHYRPSPTTTNDGVSRSSA
jgi:DNA-binding CsgD family transcriptional regulator